MKVHPRIHLSFDQTWKLFLEGQLKDLTEIDELPEDMGKDLCQQLSKMYHFMPSYDSLYQNESAPKWMLKNDSREEITFFGGTFNPWHQGHRQCLDLCPQKNIMVVPDLNPWKQKEISGECRWKVFKSLWMELKDTDYSIYPGFLGLDMANPTIDWLPKVSIPLKNLIIGDDNFFSIDKWKESAELLAHRHILYVCPRLGDERDKEKQSEKLLQLCPDLRIEFLEHHAFESVSSTALRKK